MFNYKKYMCEIDCSDNAIEIVESKEINLFGTSKELLYLAARILEFVEKKEFLNELTFSRGVDLSETSTNLRIALMDENGNNNLITVKPSLDGINIMGTKSELRYLANSIFEFVQNNDLTGELNFDVGVDLDETSKSFRIFFK